MSTEVVIDASIAADLVLSESKRQALLEHELFNGRHDFHAPTLIDFEVTSTIRKALLAHQLTEQEAWIALEEYFQVPISRYADAPLMLRALQLRENISAYDGTYVALTEAVNGVMITRDIRLARAASRHCEVLVL